MTSADITTTLLAKIYRIVHNTDATRKDFVDYRRTNDARVGNLEAELKELALSNAVQPEVSICGVENAKQQVLKNNMCISGIPKLNNEDPAVIVKAAFDAIGVKTDIITAYRTNKLMKTSGLIVVKLPSFEFKLDVLKTKKAKPNLSIQHINIGAKVNSLVFINNQLTPYFSKLAVKEGRLESRWMSGNGLKIKFLNGSIRTVKTEAELKSTNDENDPTMTMMNLFFFYFKIFIHLIFSLSFLPVLPRILIHISLYLFFIYF